MSDNTTPIAQQVVEYYKTNLDATIATTAKHFAIRPLLVRGYLAVGGVEVKRGTRVGGSLSPAALAQSLAVRRSKALNRAVEHLIKKHGPDQFFQAVESQRGTAAVD